MTRLSLWAWELTASLFRPDTQGIVCRVQRDDDLVFRYD